MKRNKLYAFLLVACIAGFGWLVYNLNYGTEHVFGACLFKDVTSVPCPSCGSTRAIVCLFHGEFANAAKINPLGIILFLIMCITPIWIAIDFFRNKNTLHEFYQRVENKLQKPVYMFPAIAIIVVNWIWNITKGL
jgi:hypothetical protein